MAAFARPAGDQAKVEAMAPAPSPSLALDFALGVATPGTAAEAAAQHEPRSGCSGGSCRVICSGSPGRTHGAKDLVSAAPAIVGTSRATTVAPLAKRVALYHNLVAKSTTRHSDPKWAQPLRELGQALGVNLPP